MSPAALARFSSGGVAICYVLPVLWMTSRFIITDRIWDFNRGGAESDVYDYLVNLELYRCSISVHREARRNGPRSCTS